VKSVECQTPNKLAASILYGKISIVINLQFTINEEVSNQITYIDLNLINKHGQIKMEIYRKSTTTDITINNKSCHPREKN
jgi:hypothetical protein